MKSIMRTLLLNLVCLLFIVPALNAQTSEDWLRHAATYDSYGRDNGNDPESLQQALDYCDSVIKDKKATENHKSRASRLKNRILITLKTCENNLNFKIEFYQFFLGIPAAFASNSHPDEHALGIACRKVLDYSYPGYGSVSIKDLNIHTILLNGNCDDSLAETTLQILAANTKHVLISKQDIYDILGKHTDSLYLGNKDTALLNSICSSLGVDRLGFYLINRIDSVDNLRFAAVSFQVYSPKSGMGSLSYADAFGTDKRNGQLHIILYLLLSSMILITLIAVCEELFDRWKSKTWHLVTLSSFFSILWLKIKLVAASQFLPTILSFLIVTFIQPLAPEMSTHFRESESLIWVIALTLSMSLAPTLINLLIINRLDLDGFHTPRGYQNFANASVYGSYFTLFYFYSIKYEHIAQTQHLILIGVTFLVGLILGESIFLILNKKSRKPLFYSGILGVTLTLLLLVAINLIILANFKTQGFVWSIGISAITAAGFFYAMGIVKDRLKRIEALDKTIKPESIVYVDEVVKTAGIDWVSSVLKPQNTQKIPIFLISGPMGVGKTAILHKLLEPRWREQYGIINRGGGYLQSKNWYYGDCNETQESNEMSFEPFVEAFGSILGIDKMEDRGNVLGAGMESILKKTAGTLNEAAAEILTHKKRDDMRSISEYCNAIAEELEKRNEPTVFILEDLHWIDIESRNFLTRFLKIVSMGKHFPNVANNLKIIFTIRSGQNMGHRGLSEDEIAALLGEWDEQFEIVKVSERDLFNFKDFVVKFGNKNPKFKLSDASMNLINDLLNQRDTDWKNKKDKDQAVSGLTPLYIVKLLSKWMEEGTLTPVVGGLVLTRQITVDDLPNSEEIDKFYHTIFDKIPSTAGMDSARWVRILESAAIIGHKFDASILASVWGLDLLQLLDFLERMEVMELVQDVPGQDNIYRFHNPRVSSALKSYFGKRSISEEKQIVMEYNKRWLNVQFTSLYPCSYMDIERLNIIARRLFSLRNLEAYSSHFKKVWLILSLRYCLKEEFEKMDMLMFKSQDSANDNFLRSIQAYREFIESEISHDFIGVPEDNPQANSLNWYMLTFNKIVSGEMETEEFKACLNEFSLTAEPIFIEFLVRLIDANEHFIQTMNSEIIEFLDKILVLKNTLDSDFIMLVKMLRLKLFASAYCTDDYEDAELLEELYRLKSEFNEKTSRFIRYEFHHLKSDLFENMDDSPGQVASFKDAIADLRSEDKINRNWVNYILEDSNNYIFDDLEIDFEKIFHEISYFLQMRGYLEEINELHVSFREAYFKMRVSDRYAKDLSADQIEKIKDELLDFIKQIETDKHISHRLKLTYKARLLFQIQQYKAHYFFKNSDSIKPEEYEKSLQVTNELIALYKELNDNPSLEVILDSKAKILRKLKKYDEAVAVHIKSLKLVEQLKNLEPYKKGLSHYHYALTLKEQGSLQTASEQLLKSMNYWSDNAKGKIRKRITEMQILECVLDGNLKPADFFEVPLVQIYNGLEALLDNPLLLKNLYDPDKLKLKLTNLKALLQA